MANPKLGVDLAGPDLAPTYQGDLALVEDKANVKGAILRRLNTPLGGLFAHPWYGNPVFNIISEPMDESWQGKAIAGIWQCLEREPRIRVESVSIEVYPEQRIATFNIMYSLIERPGSENLVWQVNIP